MLILFMFLRSEQMSAALREELKDAEYTELFKCDTCSALFETLTTHNDKELGTIEACDSCLAIIKQQEKQTV